MKRHLSVKQGTVMNNGACHYCDQGVLSASGMGIVYPYKTVIVVEGKHIRSNFCEECFKALPKAIETTEILNEVEAERP